MIFKKNKYKILEDIIHTSNKNERLMNNYDTRDYYRRLFTKDGPLKKYYKDVDEKTYKKILTLYGELILQKIMNADFYDFPVENAGRILVTERKMTKKYLLYHNYSKFLYYICWAKKKFKNSFYAFAVPSFKTKSYFFANVDQSKSYFYPMSKTIKIW